MGASAILLALIALSAEDNSSSHQLTVNDVQVTLIDDVRTPAREAGVLTELSVKEGDLVEAGAELGRIDLNLASMDETLARIEHEIAKLQSENDVDRRYASKNLQVSEAELKRSLNSNEVYPRSISDTHIDRLRLVVEQSSLSIEQAERDLRIAGLTKQLKEQTVNISAERVDRRHIVAPLAGMVVEVFRKPGEWLSEGDPVVRIIRMDRLRVEAFVNGRKHGTDLIGCPVQFKTHLPPGNRSSHFDGKVVFVSPELQPVNGQVRVWAEVENRDLQLRPGARGTLIINLTKSALLANPNNAELPTIKATHAD